MVSRPKQKSNLLGNSTTQCENEILFLPAVAVKPCCNVPPMEGVVNAKIKFLVKFDH